MPITKRTITFRYRGHRVILRYYSDEFIYAVVTRTEGKVDYYCNFWSVTTLDRITESIDRYISVECDD